jgi:putative membrane protein
MTPLVPLQGPGPHGFHGAEENSLSVLPFLASFLPLLLILLLALTALYLWRKGKLPLPNLRRRPEDEAKRILAERFARGDISTDEFMERSSILNWTPGVDPLPSKPRKNRG